ncbi:MAG: peptide chain release factor N(5)-glutamine methyltransferase [Saprospiraceae bacterium]|nr:peptide chain release factor N(5)-glutamine methyltransferase [Saprospiraceae bacterium]
MYQTFTDWAAHHFAEREMNSLWRWIEDYLKEHEEKEHFSILKEIMVRLASGEPIQYITNRAYFFDMQLFVNENVLIPRPETEELVYFVADKLKHTIAPSILDVGTGSGCIILGIAGQIPDARCYGCDVDDATIEVARANAEKYEKDVEFFKADFTESQNFDSLPQMDVIVSNPPYILESEKGVMSPSTVFEPYHALFSREGAMWAYEAILELAMKKLKRGGLMAFELSEYHVEEVLSTIESKQFEFEQTEVRKDLQDKPRVLMARKK